MWNSLRAWAYLLTQGVLRLLRVRRAALVDGATTWPVEAQRWAKGFLSAAGIEVRGGGRLAGRIEALVAEGRSVILCANHASYCDVLVLFSLTDRPLRFVAAKKIARIPWLGRAMRATHQIIIDRTRGREALNRLRDAAWQIAERPGVVVIFPTGTRTPGRVGKFKPGAFVMAREAHAVLLPVSLVGTDLVWRDTLGRISAGRVVVRVGDPIPAERDAEALRAATQAAVEALFVRTE